MHNAWNSVYNCKIIFAVISQKVNMAARLMMKFPNEVTCDEATKIKSKLPEEDFTKQLPVVLKGIADTGTIYAYSTVKYVYNFSHHEIHNTDRSKSLQKSYITS